MIDYVAKTEKSTKYPREYEKKKKKVQNVLWEKKYNRQKSFDKVVSINLAMSLL